MKAAIHHFFDCLPTPHAVIQAYDETIKELVTVLGLQDNRCAAVKRSSEQFLTKVSKLVPECSCTAFRCLRNDCCCSLRWAYC